MRQRRDPTMRRAILLAVAALLTGTSALATQQYAVTVYTNADGLPQAQVLSVFQDSRGHMWFGTYGGVARYDGAEYRIYAEADGLVGNVVHAIAESRGGRMFFGTSEGVTVLSGETLTELKGAEGESIRNVRRIFTDTRRGRWIATAQGLYRERGGVTERFGVEDGLPSESIFTVVRDAGGYLWVGTERGLARLIGDRFRAVGQGLPQHVPVHALMERGGELWVGTETGIFLHETDRFRPVDPPPGTAPALRSVIDATLDPGGAIWFATLGGVMRVRRDAVVIDDNVSLLRDAHIKTLLADREGNLWFGTDNGVAKLVPGPFVGYGERNGLPHAFIRDLAEDAQGRIWIATRDGVAVMERDERIWSIGSREGLTDTRAYAVAPLVADDALIGTPSGLFLYRDGRAVRFTEADGLPSDTVRALYRLSDERVWIGTAGGLAMWNRGSIIEIAPDPEIGVLDVMALESDPEGKLWIATRNGKLAVYGPDGFEPRGQSLGLEQVELWSLAADWDGGMWVGTNGHGAVRINGDQVLKISTAEGLANDFVWQVLSDRAGRVWFYTNRGLDRWDGTAIVHYGIADGLLDLEGSANSALQDRHGNIWFGTGKGLTKYMPELEQREDPAPLAKLRGLSAGGIPVSADGSGEIRMSHSMTPITFEYSGLSFRDERSVRYRHRLHGLSDEWSAPTAERQISYAVLAPGRYTFEVIASNGRGVWSETPASASIVVVPAWFQRASVRVGGALLLSCSIFAMALWRRIQEKHEKERLERTVALRTRQLARSEERMRTALRDSPTFVFSQDEELRYTWAHNPLLDLDAEQILGARDTDLMEPEAARTLTALKQRVLATGVGSRREVTLCNDNTHCSLDVSVEPLWEKGRIVGVTGAAWDVTKQRELEDQLRHAQKMEVVGQLAGGVAHDFNNLLTGIIGYTQLGLGRLPANSVGSADFRQALNCCSRAADLTQQLLAFSRLQPLERTVTDLNELVEGVSKLLRRLIGEDIMLVVSAGEALNNTFVDRSQIEQVLINLAVNARDAMPSGGDLRIATENVTVDEVMATRYSGLVAGEYVRIEVADTGQGMDQETLDHVFEPFFTTKEVGKGTGLGLATVYGIVKQHDGYVYIDSGVGVGTTCQLFFPMTRAHQALEEHHEHFPVAGGQEVILLVEDEQTVREVTRRWLDRLGYTVLTAAAPSEAEKIWHTHATPIDLLLTDVVMPEMNGAELYRRLCDNERTPRVLYMSGYPNRGGGNDLDAERLEPFLRKPFDLDNLATSLREALDGPVAA